MFESLQSSLQKVFSRFGRGRRLTADNIREGLRDVRTALLEADVNFRVAKDLINEVTERAVGEEVTRSVTPGQMIVKVFHEVLTEKLGAKARSIPFAGSRPTVVMMAGLQGSGKTTTAAKLARLMQRKGRQPLLVAADTQRPAAIEQLQVLGSQIGIPVHSQPSLRPPEICSGAILAAKGLGRDIIIMDTAGRLHIDEPLMSELAEVKAKTAPDLVYLVCDAMTGQDAVNSASEFNERLAIDGVILTKLDGDTRGGAAISIHAVTGKPVAFVGVGEKIDDLEEFHPDRMASRILGMGDVVSLVEKAQEVVDKEDAQEAMEKLLRDSFSFDDFLRQIHAVKKLGSVKSLLSHLPGFSGGQLDEIDPDGKGLTHVEAIILSMTPEERVHPDLMIDGCRKRRVARGSGTSLAEVNDLLKQFKQMRLLMRQLKGKGFFGRLAGRFVPGVAGGAAPGEGATEEVRRLPSGHPARNAKELKKQRKREKEARRRNRRRR
ncbi:MAG: signal recognition particle protein [Planctomycetota bacterium]